MTPEDQPTSLGKIFAFWAPMASTWLVMALEAPFLAALIARLADPKENLAAFGVAHAVGLPAEVVELTQWALVILVPWPATIGYRRFYQGLLVRQGLTRLIALGTIVRLTTMPVRGHLPR